MFDLEVLGPFDLSVLNHLTNLKVEFKVSVNTEDIEQCPAFGEPCIIDSCYCCLSSLQWCIILGYSGRVIRRKQYMLSTCLIPELKKFSGR